MKKKITILAIVSIISAVILSTVFVASNITSIQEWLQKANLTEEVQADENSGISTLAANATGYKIYGEEAFTEEYSIGAFVPQEEITGIKFGTGFAHYGTELDNIAGNPDYPQVCVGTNTSKNANVYRDMYGAFKMGTEVYDVRIYFWLIEGDDFVVLGNNGHGAYAMSQSTGDSFEDGYVSRNENTAIEMEVHFYRGGTLATSRPQEVSVKGTISFLDIDKNEGYMFDNGADGIYLTANTKIVPGSQIDSSIYKTSVTNGWFGTVDGYIEDYMALHCQFSSSPSSPFTFKYFGLTGLQSGLQSESRNITYHIEGYIPDGVSYPEDTIYIANYGTYTVLNSLYASGYRFTGWNRGSINGTNVSGDTLAPITEDIDLYGKFTMDIPVKKVWNDNNDQYGERPTSVTVTLYEGNVSTRKTLVLSRYNNWSGTFSNVDASDNYTLRENAHSDYTYAVSGNAEDGFTITNTYSGPIISASKTVSPQPSVGYVLEGQKLTYTITVENDGLTSKNVIIKDTIPSGTTFVTGSIKVNNITRWYTQTNLSNGITVNVPANGSSTLSFEVTVDDLEQYEYTKRITNTGIVDGTSTNQVQTIVNKPNVTFNKTASPSSGSIVEKEDIITYTITLDNSRGTAPATVIVRDSIPTGTTFVSGSIKVGGSSTSYTSTNLSNGISVTLNAGQSKTVEFKVTVNDLNNRDTIENVATVDGTQTNQTTHTYIEPIISSTKSVTTEYNQSYAVEGETITYTITVENDGDASEDVVIRDEIPDGTSFVVGSIKTNNSTTWYTQSNLSNGITVNVPARDTATLSFEVTVDELGTYEYSKTLRNTATVDGEETNEVQTIVNKPNVQISKASSPSSGSTVEKGNIIIYTITLDNSDGTAPATVIVKDNIPTGTTFVNGSIRVGGYSTGDTASNLAQGIGVALNAGQTKTVEFRVTVNDLNNGATIENVATVDDEQTNRTIHTYIEPVISGTKSSTTENNLSYVVEGETITYTITVRNDGDLGKNVEIRDTIPDGTSFVVGSIKTNDRSTGYTQSNLSNGIEINVPARESATLSFDVIVNDITDGSLTKEIRNTAQVDGTTTNEVIETVHKPNVEISKSASPENGTKVTTNDEITYRITLDNSTGTAPTTVVLTDNIPTGTTFIDGSVTIDGYSTGDTSNNLSQGIGIALNAGESKVLEFRVRVNELQDETQIRNVATVDGETTNEVIHTYVKPIISGTKAQETENSEEYVLEGETITYTITVKNDGGYAKDVIVIDNIPEGTTLVPNSVKIDGRPINEAEGNLSSGLEVNVQPHTSKEVTFEVTVNELTGDTLRKEISNIATVDENPTNEVTTEVRKPNVEISKSSDPASGETVENGEEITYIIGLDNSTGTAPKTVKVKDTVPTETTFVRGSIKVGTEERPDLTLDNLQQGIDVELQAGESKNLEFKVTVNDLDNGTEIRNVATVDEETTNEVTHTYVEPIISAEKTSTTENSLNYVVEGEKITYTIKIKNDGDLRKDVTVTDEIPEGTSFVEGSIKVNNSTTQDTQTNLKNGITVPVEARGEGTLSFEVTVNELPENTFEKDIINIAYVDGEPTEETTDTVNKPNVEISKSSNPTSGETVENGEEITYSITLDNSKGTAPTTVNVKDSIPTGTTFVDGSIKIGNDLRTDLNADNLASGIDVDLLAGESKNLEFKVRVNELENNTQIINTATVNDEPTNETTHTYVEPIISAEKESATENGLAYAVEGEKITYTITVQNDGGLSKNVQIQDNIPEGTSFVTGSVKVNNSATQDTEATLASGIQVNVPAYGESTLSFEVIVNELTDGSLTKVIKNKATVDGTPTEEVTNTVNKADVKYSKSSDPASGDTVVAGQEITYAITLDNSQGTAPATVNVKDTIPLGTTFVEGSIKVGNEERTDLNADSLVRGISVDLNARETKNVEFKVRVNDLADNAKIENVATVNDIETNKTTHTYVEPIISGSKTAETENSLDYVVEGEKITYIITVKNDGGLADDVQIQDEVPEGTSFVAGSIQISNNPNTTNLGASDLASGITVNVPAYGEETLSFQVTVNELPTDTYQSTIRNTAILDGTPTNEVLDTVNKPNIEISKSASPADGNVIAGQEITYTITLDNSTGTAPTTVNVKDNIPEGTTFVNGSIKVGGLATENTAETLASGINVDVPAGETKTVEFKVTVNDLNNNTQIRNIATVDDETTNEVTHTYVEPIISAEKESATENGLDYVVEGEKITYTITIKNDGGLAKEVDVIDNIPEGTTFVDGSIKITNNPDTANLRGQDLENGIKVEVPEYGQATLSFDVTVDELPANTYESTIRNIAIVDETNTDEITDTVNKPNVEISKSANPASGEEVTTDNEITYIITLNNSKGTAPEAVNVKDTIPIGTTFVAESIKVGNESRTELTADNLANGIEVDLNAGESKTVEFKVRVNEQADETQIENIATVDEEETNHVEHTYLKPIISSTKTQETEYSENYVVEGEKITYTITVKNDGGLATDVQINDTVPTGTSFVENSIRINNQEQTYTQTDLQNGITVNAPAHEEATLSFEVTVNELPDNTFTGTIRNIAYVDGTPTEEITNTVNKPNVQISKSANPANGNVIAGQEITYTITLNNTTGTAPTTVNVKDNIPTETTFVDGSIKVGDESRTELNADSLTQGIDVDLQAGENKTVEFKVRVNDINNNTQIRNIATVDDEPTNETIHTYVEPLISQEKESATENNLAYVVEGEKITYTITVTNDGDLAKNVVVKDTIPEGTSFVDGSVKVNNSATQDTEDTLVSGITVPVSARGESTLSFEVTVDELTDGSLTKVIRNTATVDGTDTNEVTDTVNKSDVKFSKSSDPASGNTVVAGQEITYYITLDNSQGTAPEAVNVKDTIPIGTTFVAESIKVGNVERTELTAENLANGIDLELQAKESKTVEFKVTVNDLEDNTAIVNVATVNDTETNKTTHTYVEPIISGSKSSKTENGLDYVVEGEKITYTITVKNDGGLATDVEIQDTIPTGTSFVAGSIQISNNENTSSLGQTDLRDGITVNVPAYGNETLSFDVTVDELPAETYESTIRNIAVVDGTDTDEVTETVNKPNVEISKSASPASGTKVITDNEITYTITLDNSTGTAPDTVTVKDAIPTGTTFVEGSIKVGGTATGRTAEELASGISVDLNAGDIKTVEFKVTVNEQADNTEIRNIATVDEEETNPVIHTYVKPIISSTKSQQTANGLDYVVEGETITYTITVKNDGGYAKDVIVTDEIPEGTSFVTGSVKVNGGATADTSDTLASGIQVNVPAYGEATLSFEVTVDELTEGLTKVIRNTATVDGEPTNEVTDTVNKSDVKFSKASEPDAGSQVKAGQEITYYITLDNSQGTAPATVNVKDTIPTGTTFVAESIKVGNEERTELTSENLANGIDVELQANESKTVEFKVTVNDLDDNTTIENVATVNDTETNKTTHTYVEPIISAEKAVNTENSLNYAVEGEKLTYTITVKNDGGLATDVQIKDTIPTGTSFVENSIKVDNEEQTYTQTDLQNGITVNAPAYGEVTITFEVTVNEITDGTFTKEITNQAVVDETPTNEVKVTVNKPNVEASKSADPANGNVIAGQEITYIIALDNRLGTAPDTVTVKDTIPTGTSFVEGSIKVGEEARTDLNADDLIGGIEVSLNAGESKNLEFKVRVNDLDNNTQIRNIATVDDEPTNETTHTYVEPIISQEKESETENNLAYVVEGEKITYTITVTNDGDLAKNVVVTDTIPEGTSFVAGSIKVNGAITADTSDTLASGITVPVSARGESTLSFEVTVDELTDGSLTKVIRNTATVDGEPTEEVTDTVNKSDVKYSKSSEPASGSTVVAGQEITYYITLDNSLGTAPSTVNVKDTIPAGTTFVEESIKVGGLATGDSAENLASGISVDLSSGETKTVEFKVRVNDLENNAKIDNIATVDEVPTNKITHTYVEPVISGSKSAKTENGLAYVVEGEKITYTITVKNDGGLEDNVQIQDNIPAGTSFVDGSIRISNNADTLDLGESNLANGITVNVPAYRNTTLSFDVTVDKLPAETYDREIKNTAFVDGEPTDEITEIVNKPNVQISKTAEPQSGTKVITNNEITYTITLDNSIGTAPTTVTAQDTIPTGTTFIEGSIKVGGSATENTAEELASGISVDLNAGETKTVEFKVRVNEQADNTEIRNVATVDGKETEPVIHTYVKPIISSTKAQATENGEEYVLEGETITYTITVKNDGGYAKDVIVTDEIPEGTTLVPNSVKIDGREITELEGNLSSGLTVNVQPHTSKEVTFEVTVNKLTGDTLREEISNTATVDEELTNEVTTEVRKPNVEISKSADPANGNVIAGQEITYTIKLDNSTGTAPTTVIVKDIIPEGTTFVDESVKVGNIATNDTADTLASGISVDLQAGETKNVEFKVIVNDLNNGIPITNTATVDDESTNETEHTYLEPIISAEKESATENNLPYVVEGEKITYTITIKNDGDLAKNVVVKDTIPEGTSFVAGSIKVNGGATADTSDTLASGITVPVAERGESTLSFEVTVDELTDGALTKVIRNTATVDGTPTEEITNTVNKSDVKYSKSSIPANGEEVEVGYEITYTITLDNSTGRAPATVNVKDTIPTGTSFVTGSIRVGETATESTAEELASGISVDLSAGETKTVEFKVTVNDLENNAKIDNIATVNDVPTNKTTHTYVEPIISGSKSAETENGLAYVVEGETITYTITVKNDGGLEANVEIQDTIPKGTSFVERSIQISNNENTSSLGQVDLSDGITVNVPEYGEETLSFQVTVNDLPEDTFEETIRNTATVDGTPTNDITETVNKPNVQISKSASPANGNVISGQEITYYITLDNRTGTAPTTVNVKDTIPTGTSFVTGSIRVGDSATESTAEDLVNGIDVDLNAGETKNVEFKVTVNDIENGTPIRNIATVDDEPTNETTHTYVESIISGSKSAETENGLAYVVEGEKITYTITIKNDGDLAKDVTVKDTIPEGTTFVDDSISIVENGTAKEVTFTKDDLEGGIVVNVGAQNETNLTFQVTVNELTGGTYEYTIRNTATVDGNNTNEVTNEVNKSHVRIGKTSEPATGEKVTANDEIRYVIVLENTEGTAPTTLTVKDTIPTGTTFVENSIRVNDIDLQNSLEDLTTNGINVLVPAGQTSTVEFKVKVQDLDNGYIIRNKASVENPETQEIKETNEVTHEYVEAIIEANKEMTTERNLSYVIPGETITYTIRIRNTGDLSKKITVKDNIPEGTEFVEGSVLLNGTPSNVTQEQLESGITVDVGDTEQTISFTVTVLEGATEIKNTAVVDGENTNETKVPVISYEKTAEVIRQTEENIAEGTVTAGDKIKYIIRINNLGEDPVTDVTIKDIVPTGTTLSKVYNSGITNDKNEITWTIDNITVGESKEVSFEVTVNYDVIENKNITNVATVDGEETNEVETPYDKPEIKEESTIEKTGTEKVTSTEDEISYKITYTASIKDFVGEGKVTIVDYLPYEIDIENQYLDGGFYDAKTKTITWEQDLGTIDTYINGDKTVTLEKEITVKYLYGEDAETLEGTIPNRVEGTLQLTQEDPENPLQDKTVLEDKKEATHETEVQIPTYIIVHHYIEGTNIKVPSKIYGEIVEDERQEGFVGQDYKASASSNVQENYQVVSNSGNTTGSMTRTPIEVIYYYRLQPGNIVTNTITKDGTDKIINKDDKLSYTLTYTGRIENYVGNAKVEIVDYLPFAIDERASNLNGGLYNPANHTITWTEDLGRVNTYTDGPKDISLSKNIEVVFTEMNFTETRFTNRAQGKITLEETNQEEQTPETSKETETEFIKDVTVEKVWDDNEDIKGRRPESVTVQLTANGQVVENIDNIISTENTTTEESSESEYKVVLNAQNNWTYTFQDLPKYTEQGQEINYSVVETETNPGDLEYYENANIEVFNTDTTATIRVTNSYKLMDTLLDSRIEKTGTGAVASSSQEVNYNIKYNATVTEYIGTGLVTITDYLPYAIDVEKSELDGGTYDALRNTITWTQNIDHINTYTDGDYQVSIEKNISIVFTNLDATAKAMVNRVTGRINLYENETTNTVETTYETKIEIPGNVIVKYVDRNTGVEIAEGYELKGLAGDSYRTELKDIYGYTFVESTNNTSGNMIEGTIEVIYYYERTNAGGVIVHYVDEEGNKLADDVTITGKVADPYRTEQKDIPNYDFVRVEGQTEGELIEGTIEVTYIYTKIPAKVIVQHLEKDDTPDDNTDNVVLAEEEIIEGFSGDSYSTARKEIENYQPADPEPENAEGTMTKEDIYVTYYYERKTSGIVTVKYVDVDTNEEILRRVDTEDGEEYVTYREQMNGLCGLEYTTEQKDIPYYNFVEDLRPSNAKGIYTEEDIEVIYYYRKQTFNLSVEKQINRITVNGKEHSLKDALDQIDVVASEVQETDIVVTYKIVVSNPGEIEGTATVIENIPEFFRIADGTSSEWTENGKSLETQVTLQPGETKELIVVLRWIKNSNNFGLQVNTVTLQKVENPANYEETDLSDNTSIAEVLLSVKTGGIDTSIVIGTALVVMLGALMITIYLKEKKRK